MNFIRIEGDLVNLDAVARIRPVVRTGDRKPCGVELEFRNRDCLPAQYFKTTMDDIEKSIEAVKKCGKNFAD